VELAGEEGANLILSGIRARRSQNGPQLGEDMVN